MATISACHSTTDLTILTDELVQLGWAVTAPDELDDRAIESYAATILHHHIGFGEVSNARIKASWDLALATATGARNLVQVADSPTVSLWFVYDDTGSVLRIASFTQGAYSRVSCLASFRASDMQERFQKIWGDTGQNPNALPVFMNLQPVSYEHEDLKLSLNVSVLNSERVSNATGSEIEVSSIFSARTTLEPEAKE